MLEESISRTERWVEVELSKEIPAPKVIVEHRQEEDVGPSESIGEKDAETEEVRESIPVEVEEEVEVEPPETMNLPIEGGGGPPPPHPMPPIDPLVRPRGLPIRFFQNLVPRDMPVDLPKFYETRDDDPSRHMERYIERMIFALITNQGYWFVWFSTTLNGETYEWYRDHDVGHFMTWNQLLREFLIDYRPEVDQSTTLRTLVVMRLGRDEGITAYVRRLDSVCSRYVGIMLNEDTLEQFFI